MSTVEEGGATAINAETNSSCAGGKFRKKPIRRQTTPYDRPPTGPRVGINNANSKRTWLTKLVVEPASRIISYGAHRLFASVFTPRLPPPQLPQPFELNNNPSEVHQGAFDFNPYAAQKVASGEDGNPIHSSSCSEISELEQLLKRNTFSRYEIDYLKRLLQSRVQEASPEEKREENEGIRLRGVLQTPSSNFKVHEECISSPAELAKAYMGSRSSKVSPSMLGVHSQVGRGGAELINSVPFASKSPIVLSRPEIFPDLGTRVNKFTTPRSGGRSAIYNMARSPYSRFHITSTMKGGETTNTGSTESSVLSSPFSPIQHGARNEPKQMSLKRRRSILDDEVGSVGRIQRQKTDLFASATKVGIGSAKKLPLIGKSQGELPKGGVGQSGNVNEPSKRQFSVPKRSSEIAARILQHLENASPKGKSAESQLFSMPEKSPFRASPDVIRERTVNVDSSRHAYFQEDHKVKDTPDVSLFDSRDSSFKQGGSEEPGPKETAAALYTHNPVKNIVTPISLEASGSRPVTVARNGVSQPLENRVFTMSEQKESLQCEGNILCNGAATGLLSEGRSIDDSAKMVKTTIQSEVKSIPRFLNNKTSEVSGTGPFKFHESTVNHTFPDTENTTQSTDFSVPVTANVQAKNADSAQILTLPSESIIKTPESKLESPCSLVNVSPPTGGQLITPDSELNQVNNIGQLDAGLSTTTNGPVPSKEEASASLFTMASPNHTSALSVSSQPFNMNSGRSTGAALNGNALNSSDLAVVPTEYQFGGSSSSTSVFSFSTVSSSTTPSRTVERSPFGNINSISPKLSFGQASAVQSQKVSSSSIIETAVKGSLESNNVSGFSVGLNRGIDKPRRRIITFKKSGITRK